MVKTNSRELCTGISVKRATKALDVKLRTDTMAKPATYINHMKYLRQRNKITIKPPDICIKGKQKGQGMDPPKKKKAKGVVNILT